MAGESVEPPKLDPQLVFDTAHELREDAEVFVEEAEAFDKIGLKNLAAKSAKKAGAYYGSAHALLNTIQTSSD